MLSRPYLIPPDAVEESDNCIVFHHGKVYSHDSGVMWAATDIMPLLGASNALLRLEVDGRDYIAVHLLHDLADALNANLTPLRNLLFTGSVLPMDVAGRASQLVDWYNSHRYCGSCGGETRHQLNQQAVHCPVCNVQYFPRINPCAIVLVVDEDRLLLARSARYRSGFYSCVAGFIEVGESAEDTVRREVKEEVGVEVGNVQYLKSQSWPFPSQLMLGFIAQYAGGDIVPEEEEIEHAAWFRYDQLPPVPSSDISVAGELIDYYVRSRHELNAQVDKRD